MEHPINQNIEKGVERLKQLAPWQNPYYAANDMGNSLLLANFYQPTMRYVKERKCWYVYDDRVWKKDEGGLMAMERCKELAMLMSLCCYTCIPDPVQRDMFIKRIERWQSRSGREIILKDAAGVHPLDMAAFDADPMLFNCPNGTLNLRDLTFRPHDPADLLTMVSGAEYHPEAVCERWDRFVDEVMQPAQPTPLTDGMPVSVQKKTYLQMALGYALTGMTHYECLFILYGATTRNGKGTMMESILRMMGDYGKTAMPDTIGVKHGQSSSAPSEDVARLRGARFVNISEPDKKLTLSAALIKQLTGSDTITARFLHENSFEFRPQFKMFINTNYLPQVTDLTLFSSGRIKTIPFERHFEPGEQDRSLKMLFAKPQNLSAILNWCVDGLHTLRELGFAEPPAIAAATGDYRKESDKVAQFVEEMLVEDKDGEMRTADVYRLYHAWCEDNGYMSENARNFKREIGKYGRIVKKRPKGVGGKEGSSIMMLGYKAA